MDDSPTISSKLILPPDVLYEIAQILGKHGAEPTLLNLSLTSTRTYCPTTPLLFRKKHLVMDDDVVGDLLDFYSIGFPPRQNLRPRQRSAVNKDRLQGDTWNPKVIASSKSGRTAWKCQWTETLHIYCEYGLVPSPRITLHKYSNFFRILAARGLHVLPRIKNHRLWPDCEDTLSILSIVPQISHVLPNGKVEHVCVFMCQWDWDLFLPLAAATLTFHFEDTGHIDERCNELQIDVRRDNWYVYDHGDDESLYDDGEDMTRRVLSYLFRRWSQMKARKVAMTPRLNFVRYSRQDVMGALNEFNEDHGADTGGLLAWNDLKDTIKFWRGRPYCGGSGAQCYRLEEV